MQEVVFNHLFLFMLLVYDDECFSLSMNYYLLFFLSMILVFIQLLLQGVLMQEVVFNHLFLFMLLVYYDECFSLSMNYYLLFF